MSGENGQTTAEQPATTQVIRRRPTPLSQRDPVAIAKHFVASGFFKDTNDLSKAVVKIVAGEELGLGPMASMRGIYIIEGQTAYSGNLLATKVKQHPTCDYRVIEHTTQRCEIEFTDNGEVVGTTSFTMEEASKIANPRTGKKLVAGANWKNYPEAMLFNRALAKGVRMHIPHVTAGVSPYIAEELGAEVDAVGNVVNVDGFEQQGAQPVEELTGEVVVDQGEPKADETDTVDAEVVDSISKARAGRIYDAACSVEQIEPGDFARAVSFHLDRDCGDITTKKAAVEALSDLTERQATEIEKWIERQRPNADAEGEE